MPQPRPGYPAVLAARIQPAPARAQSRRAGHRARIADAGGTQCRAGRGRRRRATDQRCVHATSRQAGEADGAAAPSEPGADSRPVQGRLEWDPPPRSLDESEASQTGRALSVEHEEVWLILAGFLLRPGFGVPMDDLRIDGLWRICRDGLRFPGKRTKLQEYILWRRAAGGLSGERQEILLASEQDKLRQQKNAPPELIRMAGSFERIGRELKAE